MLRSLLVQNVVLIERLELAFAPGLCVLTGETGAGKSILIDALGLVLGGRAEARLIRPGAAQASVTACFEPAKAETLAACLAELGLEAADELIVRRVLAGDGRTRAFINDQPVGVAALKRLAGLLVELVGQDEADGLLDVASHRDLLDDYGGHSDLCAEVARRHAEWRTAVSAAEAAAAALAEAKRDEDYLRHALEELGALDPKPDEEAALAAARTRLQHGQRIAEALSSAEAELAAQGGVALRLRAARRLLERVATVAGELLDPPLAALDRAALEADEAAEALRQAARGLDPETGRLERIEERLFALRAAARKQQTTVDALPAVRARFAAALAALDGDDSRARSLAAAHAAARQRYRAAADTLRAARRTAAAALDQAVAAELRPLRLGAARFATLLEPLEEAEAGPHGIDRVRFAVATVPGAPPGPLQRIASGGERARFTLALKLALARASGVDTVVFDEIDSGVGGAVAAAVGERLARLSRSVQVLAVTHSPQVAARGELHLCVRRRDLKGGASTRVDTLAEEARREEIARMLSGARVTDEARAAAMSLLAGRGA
jgi:DNA repair protein RecN (Recombination protein N)